jgi:hypothetical protein
MPAILVQQPGHVHHLGAYEWHPLTAAPPLPLLLQTELREWQNNPPEGCLLDDCEDLTTWRILMQGPDPVQGLPALYADELYRYHWVLIP